MTGGAQLGANQSQPLDATSWSSVVDRLADAVLVANRDGTICYWNAAAERLFGWPAAEAIGATLDLIIPERHRARHWEGYRRTVETGVTSYGDRLLEVPALHRDDRPLSIAFTLTLVTDETGRVTHLVAVARDDTARWQERRQLRAEVARLRAKTESAASSETMPAAETPAGD